MTPSYTEKSWFALKIFFGKGKPIKDYFVTNNIEHVYDVKKEFWDKTKKKCFVKDVPVMPSLILFRTTRVEAEHIERLFLNKVMLYRGKNSRTRSTDFQDCCNLRRRRSRLLRQLQSQVCPGRQVPRHRRSLERRRRLCSSHQERPPSLRQHPRPMCRHHRLHPQGFLAEDRMKAECE